MSFAFRTSEDFLIIHQINAGKYLYEADKTCHLDRKATSTERFVSSQKVQMAGKIVQMVEELSISHRGRPALTSSDLDQMERARKYTLILAW